MSTLDSPIPLSELEGVLAWVDTFKLSRPTKKINRDFSDAVLLAEILAVHYPKLVEMHNYPPRNSHALKLNNWMTLNRKVLKKLRLNLCCNTMEMLANSAPGVIERVLIMVRDKIRRDEDLNKSMKDAEQNVSSGGSYYEACGDDEHILVVPVKARVNGVLETVQQKVVSYDSYQAMKEELKDAKDAAELLKQKVDHLEDLLKLKDERIEELQKQLDRKQARRKEAEAFQNSLAIPFETVPSPIVADVLPVSRKSSLKIIESNSKMDERMFIMMNSKIPKSEIFKAEELKIQKVDSVISKTSSKPSITEVTSVDVIKNQSNVEKIKSELFKENKVIDSVPLIQPSIEIDKPPNIEGNIDIKIPPEEEILSIEKEYEENIPDPSQDIEEFKDSVQDAIVTIEETIQKEIKDIVNPSRNPVDLNYII